jgi:hypothetical protein
MSELERFRTRVIETARELFPEIAFAAHPEAVDVILAGDHQLGLQNIRAKYSLSMSPGEDLSEIVRAHLSLLLRDTIPVIDDFSYSEISAKLFPQIMPADFAGNPELPLLSYPLGSATCIGIVADFPKTYMYLRDTDVELWGVASQAVYSMALKNLAAASKSVPINQAGAGKDVFLAIDSCDGYDAARILVPGFQAFLATHLGETFRFGIPNRDFLICWRVDCDPAFHRNLAEKIAADHGERPYPLSSSVFVRNSEGNIREQPAL